MTGADPRQWRLGGGIRKEGQAGALVAHGGLGRLALP